MSSSDEMASLLASIGKLVRSQQQLTKAVTNLAHSTGALAEAAFTMLDTMAGEDEPDSPAVDMAGNPIRPS